MQVFNNIPAFSVWKSYTFNVTNLRKSMSRLSSGLRINMAGDDPAGLDDPGVGRAALAHRAIAGHQPRLPGLGRW